MAVRRGWWRAALVAGAAAVAAAAQGEPEAATDVATARAGAWLEATIEPGGWLAGTVSNARGKRVVAESLAAWLALVRGTGAPPAAARRDASERALAATVAGRGIEDAAFACWLLGSAAFPLAEATLRDGAVHPLLPSLVARLGALRNSEGVWAHGSMEGTVAGYPSTVLAATNWAITALGFAAEHGVAAPWLGDATGLLTAVQAPNGGMPYGGRPYRIGIEAGRTAGSLVALIAAGAGDSPGAQRAAEYLWHNLRLVPDGHASPAMHVWNGALAAYALGDAAWRRYADLVLARVVAAQRADGSFDDIAGAHSPDTMALMGDELSGRAYVTAAYAAALSVPRSRLGAWLRQRMAFAPPIAPAAGPPAPPSVWRADAAAVVALAASRDAVFALGAGRALTVRAAPDGAVRWTAELPIAVPTPAVLTLCGERLVAWCRDGGPVGVFDLAARRVAWHGTVALAPFAGVRCHGDELCAVAPDGTLAVRRLVDGAVLQTVPLPPGLKRSVLPLANGTFLGAADARLVCLDRAGEVTWRGRNRGATAQVAATWSALLDGGLVFWGGSTDGELVCRRVADGDRIWSRQLDGGVVQLARDEAAARLAVLTAGGVVSVFDARGTPLWSADVSGGLQDPADAGSRLLATAAGPWVHATGRGRLLAYAWDGTPRLDVPVAADAAWAASGDRVVLAEPAALVAFAAP
ncbi:MAG: PQQ-binding-like beta-propeller repeat protein [Planctomycetes bacterium]|nr:PQQ-binding-like beta-propeller repeat protein [Planctomycetota bacterium]